MEWLAVARTLSFHVVESPMIATEPGRRFSLLTPARAPGMLRDIWKTHRRLAADGYAGAQSRGALLHQTSFVRMDRSELGVANDPQSGAQGT